MTNARFGTIVGLALGAIWVFGGFSGAVLAGVLAAVGFVIGLLVEGRVDVTEYLGHRHE